MSDYKMINFGENENYELNHILSYQFKKKETKENRDLLKKIGDHFKETTGKIPIDNKKEFYKYAKQHAYFMCLK